MAQYVEVEGVGTVEFPDGMSRDDMAAALKQLPTPKAEPKPEPKKAEKPRQDFATTSPMGEDLGSAIMGQAGEGLGVMSGKTPAAPVKTPSKAPLRPEIRAAIEAEYDAASPKKRANMEKAPGAVGDVIRQRAQEYEGAEQLPPTAKKLAPAVEERTQRLVEAGEKPEFAQATAERGAELGIAPGKELQALQAEGVAEPTQFDFDIYNQYKNANPVVRGAMAGWQGYKQGALGINQAVADLLGADEFAASFGKQASEARNVVQSMGENPSYAGRMFEGAINSVAQQMPALFGGVLTGSEALVLSSMFAQAFGQEYAEGTAKGLSGATAATRAGLYAAFEVVGEKFGLKFQMDKIRQATQGMSNDVLKGWLGNTLKKELPGEILTTTGQFLTDLSSVGLSPNATFGDYLQQVGDTTVQTLMQSGLMAGGSKVLSKGVEKLQDARPDFALADAIRQDVASYLESGKAPTIVETERRLNLGATPQAPIQQPVADPRVQTLAQSYQEQGMPPEQAQAQAQAEIEALQPSAASQQPEVQNVPTTEPPPFVTEPSTDERGIPVPSKPAGAAERPATAIDRGLGAASSAARQFAGREETERAALEKRQELAERTLSRGFAMQPYPDLGVVLGASWVRNELAKTPTPEEYQEAAYARLEELGGIPPTDAAPAFERRAPATPMVGERPEARAERPVEAAPAEAVEAPPAAKTAEPIKTAALPEATPGEASMPIQRGSVAAVPMALLTTPEALKRAGEVLSVPDKTPERIRRELDIAAQRGGLSEREAREIIGEKPSGTETPKTVEAKAKRPAQPAERAAPLELEATRRPELEVEPEVEIAIKGIDEAMKAAYGTTATGEARKRGAGAGRPETGAAKTLEQRRAEEKAQNQFNRDITTAINAADKYSQRQELTSFKTKEEWEAAEEVRANNLNVIRGAIYGASRQPGTSKGVIAAKEYIRNLKPAEREAAQKTHEEFRAAGLKTAYRQPMEARRKAGPEYLAEQQLAMEPDLGFYDVDTITGALVQITQSPNQLEAELAARLLQPDNAPTLRGVSFVVVDKNTKLKDKATKRMLDASTVGMFSPTTAGGTVYVRGESYENQGINNEIVLHEAMHVSGSKKIDYALAARNNGMDVSADLAFAVEALEGLMGRAKAAFDAKKSVNAELQFVADSDAFTDIQEFYAYGMTNAAMKQFLLNEVPGVSEKKSGFDTFVDILLRLFGIDPKLRSGLKDLVLISHEIMKAQQPSRAQLEEAFGDELTNVVMEARRQAKNVNTAIRDLKASQSSRQIIQNIGNVQSAGRTPKTLGDYVAAEFPNVDMVFLKSFIEVAPTSVLYRIGIANDIQSLKDARDNTRKMGVFRVNAMNAMTEIATEWARLGKKEKNALADIMNLSTDVQIDPSVNTTVPELNRMWNALNPKQQKLYKNVRDFYKQSYQLFLTTIKQKIATSNLAGNIGNPATPKGKLWEDLKTTYELNMGKGPYFPLMRHGDFWAQFGKGKDLNFQMFDSAKQRDKFIKEQIKERNKRGDKRTYEELVMAREAAKGNEPDVLRKRIAKESMALRNIFSKIDTAALGTASDIAQLKNDIFQTMLLVLPENSMRKMFITRKARAGYSRDALRNFISTGTRMANQLAKMRYLQPINNNFDAAQENIRDNPKRDRLELLINEIEKRTNGLYTQPQEPGMLDKLVNASVKYTFMYLLTDMRAVFNNMWGVPSKSFPTLIKYFGSVAATKEFTKLLAAMPAQIGVKRVDSAGNVKYTFPSFGSSLVARDPKTARLLTGLTPAELQFAVRQMDLREISEQSTQTADLYFGNKAKTMSTPEVVLDTMVRVSGALHQGSERIAREITFLTAYKLSRQKGMSPMEAVDNAQNITEEALYRYLPDESPPFLNRPVARLAFQFKKYALYTAFYYYMNFKEMTGSLPSDVRKGAAYAFFGSMMMGALGAGVTNAFGISTMMWIYGALQAAINNLYEDDPESIDISQLDIVRWFNNVYLVDQFGDAKIPGTDVKIVDVLSRGVFDAFTGINLSSGISEGGLWFRDLPNEFDMNALAEFMTFNNLAPFVGIARQQTVQAYKEWSEGDTLKAIERWIPMKMLRSPAVAYRYSKEGVLDKDLDPIREAEDFTAGQLVAAGLGFKTSGLAEIQDLNAFLKKEERKIEDKKQGIVNAWVKAMRRGDEELIENASRRVYEFNLMYPREDWAITPDTLDAAFEGKLDKIKLRGRELTEENIADEKLREKALQQILDEAKE